MQGGVVESLMAVFEAAARTAMHMKNGCGRRVAPVFPIDLVTMAHIQMATALYRHGRIISCTNRYNESMRTLEDGANGLRPVITAALVGCVGVAMAPWLTGGREPVGLLLSGFALLLGGLLIWRQPDVRRLGRGPLWWSYAALMAIAILSLLWTANHYASELWIVRWTLAGLAFWLAYVIAGEPKGRRWLVNAYLVSAGLFAGVALGMYLVSDYDRLTGVFYWPNPAAAYLMPAWLLALDRLRRAVLSSAILSRGVWLWGGLSTLIALSFLLTSSRASFVVFGFVLVIYLVIAQLNRRAWLTFVFSFLIAFVLSILLGWLSSQIGHTRSTVVPGSRSADVAAGSSRSVSDRLHYAQSAFEMWWDHPVGGVGAGAYGDVHPQYQRQVESASSNAHNLYLQVLAELGLLGAVALAGLILFIGFGMLPGMIRAPELVPAALGLLALALHFGMDIDADYPSLLMLAAVLAGLLVTPWRRERRAPVRWAWLVGVVVLVPIVSLYQSDHWAQRAKVAQQNEDYDVAAQEFAQASRGVAFNPDWIAAEGINRLAMVAEGMGSKDEQGREESDLALDRARQAQRLDPYDAQHHQLEGRVLLQRGDYKGAKTAFERALTLDPLNHPDYALDLATAQQQLSQTEAASRTIANMLAKYPPEVVAARNANEALPSTLANLWAMQGNIQLGRGQVTEAAASAKAALKLDPDNLRGRALNRAVRQIMAASR
jgi:O-antigen ligase